MSNSSSFPRPDLQVTPQQAALYQRCLLHAAECGRALIGGLIRDAALLENDKSARDTQLRQALQLLKQHRDHLCDRFPFELLRVFQEADYPLPAKPSGTGGALRFDQLELMDDAQVQETLELARAQQSATLDSEAALAPLNALVCSVRGFSVIRPDANPLRPVSYFTALQKVFATVDLSPAIRLCWVQLVTADLGGRLRETYGDLAVLLKEANVAPVRYSAAPTSGGSDSDLNQDIRLTVNQLRRLIVGELDAPSGRRRSGTPNAATHADESDDMSSGFDHTVPAALVALQEMRQVDRAFARLAGRRAPARSNTGKAGGARAVADGAPGDASGGVAMAPGGEVLSEPLGATDLAALDNIELHDVLRQQARGVGQVLGLEVVTMMIENMAQDGNLFESVKTIVRSLEAPLLRLAMVDPRFFSDKQHPARLLLEAIADHNARFESESNPGFGAFIQPLREAVKELQPVPIEGPEPFALCLATLNHIWGDQLELERKQREQAQNTLRVAEQRNLMAAKIAQDIRERPDAAFVPELVMAFATGPWAQVVAQAQLGTLNEAVQGEGARAATSADAEQWKALVADLFWSVHPEFTRTFTNRLVKLIPGILGRLRAGLKTIQYPPASTAEFFESLMVLHQKALVNRAPVSNPRHSAVSNVLSSALPRTEAAPDAAPDSRFGAVWLAPQEAQTTGFMDEFEIQESNEPDSPLMLHFDANGAMASQPSMELLPAGGDATSLMMGTWVVLTTDTNHMRAQLVWASPEGSMFMFTTATGRNQSMTRSTLDKLIVAGKVLLIPRQNVVDNALDAVAQTAMRNSLGSR